MSDVTETEYDKDLVVGKRLGGKSKQTLRRWDTNPKMKAMGWPDPVLLNGVRHRSRSAIDRFLENCARAGLSATT